MYIDDPTNPLHEGLLGVDVATKSGGLPTYWVEVAYQGHRPPESLFDRLRAIGFNDKDSPQVEPIPDYQSSGIDVGFITFSKEGSEMFGLWSKHDCQMNLAALRQVFGDLGVSFTPREASLSELL